MFKLIAGLGNPGKKYQNTRHNIGFLTIDRVAESLGANSWLKKFNAKFYKKNNTILIKPQTYMNNSGISVAATNNFFKFEHHDIMIVHDDLDIPFGKIKIKLGGGAGGHHGLESVIKELGFSDFYRLRIGIGKPEYANTVSYVLSNFSSNELVFLEKFLAISAESVKFFLTHGGIKCRNEYSNVSVINNGGLNG